MDFSAAAAKRSYGHFRTNDQNPQRAEFSGVSGLFVSFRSNCQAVRFNAGFSYMLTVQRAAKARPIVKALYSYRSNTLW